MSQVLLELSKLQLENLDDEWVQAIYDADFLEFEEMPPEYESVLESFEMHSFFKGAINTIDSWLNHEDDSEEEKSWTFLSHQIQHRKLIAVLAYFIDLGSKNIFSREQRNNALLASQLYFKLLAISGYKAYDVYYSQLFTQSLVCLNYPKVLCENEEKFFNIRDLTYEVNDVIKSLKHFVNHLSKIIQDLNLGPSDMNFEDILGNLLDITGGAIVNKLHVDKIELSKLTKVIYEIIDILVCDGDKRPNMTALQLLFKCLLPKLVAASIDVRNSNNIVRASYVTYSGLLLMRYGKGSLFGYNVLLQHLCYNSDGLERADARNSRVSLVFGLMSMLPRKSHSKFVKWLLTLSTTSKVAHRQIALELLYQLLDNEPDTVEVHRLAGEDAIEDPASTENPALMASLSTDDEDSQELPGPVENNVEGDEGNEGVLYRRSHTVSHAEILRAIYDRVHDASSSVRARALTMLANCFQSPHKPIKDAVEELNGAGEVSRLMAVSARCVCDERAIVRRAAVTLLHRVLDGANATRETDRNAGNASPAIQYAMELEQANEANNRNTEDSALGDSIITNVTDETVGANQSVQNNFNGDNTIDGAPADPNNHTVDDSSDSNDKSDSPQPTSNYALLVGVCRDASIVVRVSAITVLSELAKQWPSQATLDAFLAGPMHQLSDPETKVQDLVVSQVHELLINRLKKYESAMNEDKLPWMFLAGIVRHNMRRHLMKAFNLVKGDFHSINHRLIDIVSTHLGVVDQERDLQCLVLLTSVARRVEYDDLDFLLQYYYKIDDEMQRQNRVETCDSRIITLIFELCTVWSRWATVEQRTALRERLLMRLADNTNYGCRTACASLAAYLEPTNLQWATELMQSSESRALEGGDLKEWMRAADLSLVAPTPPSAALLQLFLKAITDPPAGWCAVSRGECVAGAGRLCVRSRSAAALMAPALAALLRDDSAPLPPRLNALRALADICTRYTCIVDPLLDDVCACTGRAVPAPLRRGAVRAVTRLLLGGFLRLRTPLYFKYCALLADEDQDVREPAEYYLTSCLAVTTIYHNVVDCVIYYNSDECVSQLPLSYDARQLIYDVMLQRLSMIQRLNVQCRLASEVLTRAADDADEGELSAAMRRQLLDTITVLCGPRMRLPRKPQSTGAELDLDDLQERVTTNIVSQKMKRTVAEVVVPGVLRLYARLRSSGGQLTAYLVRLATDLLTDYRAEIEELIENDEELVERVRYFQENIGVVPSFGNSRNLVTTSAPPEPDTPRASRKRPPRAMHGGTARKRLLRI